MCLVNDLGWTIAEAHDLGVLLADEHIQAIDFGMIHNLNLASFIFYLGGTVTEMGDLCIFLAD